MDNLAQIKLTRDYSVQIYYANLNKVGDGNSYNIYFVFYFKIDNHN